MERVVGNVFVCDYIHEFKMTRLKYGRRVNQSKNVTANTWSNRRSYQKWKFAANKRVLRQNGKLLHGQGYVRANCIVNVRIVSKSVFNCFETVFGGLWQRILNAWSEMYAKRHQSERIDVPKSGKTNSNTTLWNYKWLQMESWTMETGKLSNGNMSLAIEDHFC